MTLVIGIVVALLILGPLIILHEFGHYFAAKLTGVKPLEFGFGFPPRVTGFWTGSTPVALTKDTWWVGIDPATGFAQQVWKGSYGIVADDDSGATVSLTKGLKVTVSYSENADGVKTASTVQIYESGDDASADSSDGVLVGKVKDLDGGRVYIKDMLWSINWLPFGGFVRLRGEENPTAKDSLASKSACTRAFVLLAGIAVNAILPFLIFAIVSQIPREQLVGDVVVRQVLPGSPAHEAGLRSFYKILEVDGAEIRSIGDLQSAVTRRLGSETEWTVLRGIPDPFARPSDPNTQYNPDDVEQITIVPRWDPPRHQLADEVTDPTTQMRLAVARTYDPSVGLNDRLVVVPQGTVGDPLWEVGHEDVREVVPDANVGDEVVVSNASGTGGLTVSEARQFDQRLGSRTYLQEGAVGIILGLESPRVEAVSVPFTQALGNGVSQTFNVIALARNSIIGAVTGSRNPQFDAPVAVGPVGIGQLSGEVATSDSALSSRLTVLLTLAATLSISLAVINLLPIPGLDGGRLLFVIVEVVRGGKRISPERENMVHFAGFVVLIGLLIAVSVVDVSRLIGGESFF